MSKYINDLKKSIRGGDEICDSEVFSDDRDDMHSIKSQMSDVSPERSPDDREGVTTKRTRARSVLARIGRFFLKNYTTILKHVVATIKIVRLLISQRKS